MSVQVYCPVQTEWKRQRGKETERTRERERQRKTETEVVRDHNEKENRRIDCFSRISCHSRVACCGLAGNPGCISSKIFSFRHLVLSGIKTHPSQSAALTHLNTTSHSLESRYMEFKTLSPERSISVSTGTKGPKADSYYRDREAKLMQTDLRRKITNRQRNRRAGRQTGSLFSSLFLDKYLISGTLMGID